MSKMKNTIPKTQELLIVGSVILLSRVESSTVVSDGVTLTASIDLLKNCTNAELGSIHEQFSRLLTVEVTQNGC